MVLDFRRIIDFGFLLNSLFFLLYIISTYLYQNTLLEGSGYELLIGVLFLIFWIIAFTLRLFLNMRVKILFNVRLSGLFFFLITGIHIVFFGLVTDFFRNFRVFNATDLGSLATGIYSESNLDVSVIPFAVPLERGLFYLLFIATSLYLCTLIRKVVSFPPQLKLILTLEVFYIFAVSILNLKRGDIVRFFLCILTFYCASSNFSPIKVFLDYFWRIKLSKLISIIIVSLLFVTFFLTFQYFRNNIIYQESNFIEGISTFTFGYTFWSFNLLDRFLDYTFSNTWLLPKAGPCVAKFFTLSRDYASPADFLNLSDIVNNLTFNGSNISTLFGSSLRCSGGNLFFVAVDLLFFFLLFTVLALSAIKINTSIYIFLIPFLLQFIMFYWGAVWLIKQFYIAGLFYIIFSLLCFVPFTFKRMASR